MNHDPGQDQLLDHNYDGIQEYDNPMPKWWLYIFYATILYSVLYWFNVPGLGIGRGRIAAYDREMAAWRAAQAQQAASQPAATVTDADLLAASRDPATLELGKATFVNNCAACHRPDGGGSIGPNLTDEYWIHGGTPSQIYHTITTGVLDKGMPEWGKILKPDQVRAAAAYVLSLHDTHPPNPKAPQGAKAGEPGESESSEADGGAAETHP